MNLLDEVDALTKVITLRVSQADHFAEVEHASLLDGDALYQFALIRTAVHGWSHTVGVAYKRDATVGELLRAWYVNFEASNPAGEATSFHLAQLRRWSGMIRAKLDPPRTKELPDRCPAPDCGVDTYWKAGSEYQHALIVQFRDGADMVEQARGLCRACGAGWSARELAYEIEQAA